MQAYRLPSMSADMVNGMLDEYPEAVIYTNTRAQAAGSFIEVYADTVLAGWL